MKLCRTLSVNHQNHPSSSFSSGPYCPARTTPVSHTTGEHGGMAWPTRHIPAPVPGPKRSKHRDAMQTWFDGPSRISNQESKPSRELFASSPLKTALSHPKRLHTKSVSPITHTITHPLLARGELITPFDFLHAHDAPLERTPNKKEG